MIPRSTIPIAAVAVMIAGLAAPALANPPPGPNNCSGVNMCLYTQAPLGKNPVGPVLERPSPSWGYQQRDRDDRFPHGGWSRYVPYRSTGTPF